MKFYLDECVNRNIAISLTSIFTEHEFAACFSEGLSGIWDIPLYRELKNRNIDVFLTMDQAQLSDRGEIDALKRGGCSWVGMKHLSGSGISKLARETSLILNVVAHLYDSPPAEPTVFKAKAAGRERGQLFSAVTLIREL